MLLLSSELTASENPGLDTYILLRCCFVLSVRSPPRAPKRAVRLPGVKGLTGSLRPQTASSASTTLGLSTCATVPDGSVTPSHSACGGTAPSAHGGRDPR
eukprot:831510-Prymnesium_polylepis.1